MEVFDTGWIHTAEDKLQSKGSRPHVMFSTTMKTSHVDQSLKSGFFFFCFCSVNPASVQKTYFIYSIEM